MEYTVFLFLFSCVLAYLLGVLAQTDKFNKLLLKVNIKRTTNANIWDDVIKSNCWLALISPTKDIQYVGQYEYGEEYKSEPIIVLSRYQILNLEGKSITDYSDDPTRKIMLNTKNFERIDVVYPRKKNKDKQEVHSKIKVRKVVVLRGE